MQIILYVLTYAITQPMFLKVTTWWLKHAGETVVLFSTCLHWYFADLFALHIKKLSF